MVSPSSQGGRLLAGCVVKNDGMANLYEQMDQEEGKQLRVHVCVDASEVSESSRIIESEPSRFITSGKIKPIIMEDVGCRGQRDAEGVQII